MPLHLIKLSVGSESLADLVDWQKHWLREMRAKGHKPELVHVTRHMPKRADEVLDGGSIYWVVKGWIVARQRIIDLRPMVKNGVSYCGIVFDKKVIPVRLSQQRAFQGWRYLEAKNAPPDSGASSDDVLPEHLRRELAELGLG